MIKLAYASALLLSARSANAIVLLNEIYVNPPGADSPLEYVEIISTTGTDSLNDIWLLEVEGDGSFAGLIDNARNLSGLSFGASGMLVLGENYNTAPQWVMPSDVTAADLGGGQMENGTVTFLLVSGFTGSIGFDLDADNNGMIDGPPFQVGPPYDSILDSVGWIDGDGADHVYGPNITQTDTSGAIDAASRRVGFSFSHDANSAVAWWGDDLLAWTQPPIIYDPVPERTRRYDQTNNSGGNATSDFITPGRPNLGGLSDLDGDIDFYYDVNAYDFLLWQRGHKKSSLFTQTEQLAHWEADFAEPYFNNAAVPGTAIPEPATLWLLDSASVWLCGGLGTSRFTIRANN